MFDNIIFQIAVICIILAVIKAIYVVNNRNTVVLKDIAPELPDSKVNIPVKKESFTYVPLKCQETYYEDNDTPLLYGSDEQINDNTDLFNFDDEFLYTEESYVNDHTTWRMHEANPGNAELNGDGRDIAIIHDEYHMGQVNRLEEDGDVDGQYENELYDINAQKDANIGYTDFATY